ncbi:MAG: fumarylacetoacetate hydrolase family protein [Actinomycetota bacterium]
MAERGAAANPPTPTTVIDAPAPVSLPVVGVADRFPVHRVFCVGRNYAEHAIEMGHDPEREPPFFFEKSPSCIVQPGDDFVYPPRTADVHHEIELVVAIGRGGAPISADVALEHVYGYAVGLDMTRRDLQSAAKAAGRPWAVGKSFDGAAPMSAVVPADHSGHRTSGAIALDVNGRSRQRGDLDQMIWSPAEIVAELSSYVRLVPGDLIMTGTPAGVGPVAPGDRLRGWIDGVAQLEAVITASTNSGDSY